MLVPSQLGSKKSGSNAGFGIRKIWTVSNRKELCFRVVVNRIVTTRFGKPRTKSSIAAISGCIENIAALKVAQHDFAQTRISYETTKAQNEILENAISVKKVLTKTINDQLVVYLCAFLLIDEENYGAFARTVSQIISDNNDVVKKRKRKQEMRESKRKAES